MASEWVDLTIGEIADVIGGSTPSTANPSYFDGDIPWLTPKDLSIAHDRHVRRGERNLSPAGLASCSARLLPRNAVLLSTRAPIGYVALAANPIATNQGFRSLVLKDGYDHEFVYYWLKAHSAELERHASGTTFRELSGSNLKRIRIRLPRDIREQRAVAGILGALDDKIELNRRMSETLEAMARALFKSWFVDFDPVRAKAEGRDPGLPQPIADLFPDRLEDSELGEIPAGWESRQLSDIMEINPPRSLPLGTTAPYLEMANMPTRGHSPRAVVNRAFTSGMRFVNGDTLVARITPCLENGKTAYVDFLDDGQVGWGSTEYIVLRPRPPLATEFGYLLARSGEFREYAIQRMTGSSGRQRVSADAIARYELATPPPAAAERFGKVVRPLFSRARAATDESQTLRRIRDGLLPKLVSGELRVPQAERLLEAAPA